MCNIRRQLHPFATYSRNCRRYTTHCGMDCGWIESMSCTRIEIDVLSRQHFNGIYRYIFKQAPNWLYSIRYWHDFAPANPLDSTNLPAAKEEKKDKRQVSWRTSERPIIPVTYTPQLVSSQKWNRISAHKNTLEVCFTIFNTSIPNSSCFKTISLSFISAVYIQRTNEIIAIK